MIAPTTTMLAYIPSPPQGVWYLGPVPIRAYALCIIIGIIVAVWWGNRRWVARGGRTGEVLDIAIWAVPFGLIGGRIYHLMTDWRIYFGDGGKQPIDALKIWDGGLGIWGAVLFGGIGAWIGARRMGIRLPPFGDAIAPAILLAQAIGRLGNYFNQELYGRETTVPWGLEIFERTNAAGQTSPALIDGTSTGQVYAIVQPTFLYELLWNVLVVVILVIVDRRFQIGHGRLFALYVAGYCAGRFGIEMLRSDPAYTQLAGVRINVFTAALLFVGAAIYFVIAPKGRERGLSMYWPWRADELRDLGEVGYVGDRDDTGDDKGAANRAEGADSGRRGKVLAGTAAAGAAAGAAGVAAATSGGRDDSRDADGGRDEDSGAEDTGSEDTGAGTSPDTGTREDDTVQLGSVEADTTEFEPIDGETDTATIGEPDDGTEPDGLESEGAEADAAESDAADAADDVSESPGEVAEGDAELREGEAVDEGDTDAAGVDTDEEFLADGEMTDAGSADEPIELQPIDGDAEVAGGTDVEPDTDTDVETDAQSETDSQPGTDSQPDAGTEIQTEADDETATATTEVVETTPAADATGVTGTEPAGEVAEADAELREGEAVDEGDTAAAGVDTDEEFLADGEVTDAGDADDPVDPEPITPGDRPETDPAPSDDPADTSDDPADTSDGAANTSNRSDPSEPSRPNSDEPGSSGSGPDSDR